MLIIIIKNDLQTFTKLQEVIKGIKRSNFRQLGTKECGVDFDLQVVSSCTWTRSGMIKGFN